MCRWGNSISTGVDTRLGLGLTITDTTLELRMVELLWSKHSDIDFNVAAK